MPCRDVHNAVNGLTAVLEPKLNAPHAPCDPKAFTTIMDSSSEPPPASASTVAAAVAPGSDADPFTSAYSAETTFSPGLSTHSAQPHYESALPPNPTPNTANSSSQAPAAAAAAPAYAAAPTGPSPFRRLPDRPPAAPTHSFSPLDPYPSTAHSTSATTALPNSNPNPMDPLSFGDDSASGCPTRPTGPETTFTMPTDLYDTPDKYTGANAVPYGSTGGGGGRFRAAAAAAAANDSGPEDEEGDELPPLSDLPDLSTTLPISVFGSRSGRIKFPPGSTAEAGAEPGGWASGGAGKGTGGAAGQGLMTFGGDGGEGEGVGGGAGPSGSGGTGQGLGVAVGAGSGGGGLGQAQVSVHSPRKAVGPSRIPGGGALPVCQ